MLKLSQRFNTAGGPKVCRYLGEGCPGRSAMRPYTDILVRPDGLMPKIRLCLSVESVTSVGQPFRCH